MKGAFMKKRICAMALTLALAAGGLSLASDLKMAGGQIFSPGEGADEKWRTDIFFRWEMR